MSVKLVINCYIFPNCTCSSLLYTDHKIYILRINKLSPMSQKYVEYYNISYSIYYAVYVYL